jgi:hypothetical protein
MPLTPMDRSVMSQPRSFDRRLLLVLAALAAIMSGAITASARAQSYGELGTPFGKAGKGAGAFSLPPGSSIHAFGVDPSDNSVYVGDEPKSTENAKGEVKAEYRIQKFSATGEVLASVSFTVESAGSAGGNPEGLEGIAVDPSAPGGGRIYALVVYEREASEVTEQVDAEEPAAGILYAFSTTPEGKLLVPAKNDKGVSFPEGVLASKTVLKAQSEATGNPSASALLEPTGIAADPTTHDVIITGLEDQGEEELLVAAQRVHADGTLGARWVDTHECLEGEEEALPPCFVENEETEQPGEPLSPVVTSTGRVLADAGSSAIWEIPKGFVSGEVPVPVFRSSVQSPLQKLLTFPGVPRPANGGSLAFVHEAAEGAGEGRLYQSALVEALPGSRYPGVLSFKVAESGGALTLSELGFTGGQNKAQHATCAISAFSQPLIGAGKGQDVFVFDPNVPPGSAQESAVPHVVSFGPAGSNCIVAAAQTPIATAKGTETGTVKNPAKAGQALTLSSSVQGANVLSSEWSFSDGSSPVTVGAYQYQTASVEHAFAATGKVTVKAVLHTDNLAEPTISTEATFTVEPANPVTQFTVSASPTVGQPVKFTSTSPTTDANKSALVKYAWKFGDGGEANATSGAPVEHSYGAAGKYTVTLKVTDALGFSGEASVGITVAGPTEAKKEETPPPPVNPGPGNPGNPGGGGVLGNSAGKGAPEAKLASTSLLVTPSGSFPVKVSCPSGVTSCSGTITLRTLSAVAAAKGKKKAILTLASGSFTVAGGASKSVTLRLSAAARKLLAKSHLLRARATLLAHDSTGKSHTTLVTVTLKPAKKQAHH